MTWKTPRTQRLVINTGPIIAIVAAMGDLDVLQLYREVCVPFEVCREILEGSPAQMPKIEGA